MIWSCAGVVECSDIASVVGKGVEMWTAMSVKWSSGKLRMSA